MSDENSFGTVATQAPPAEAPVEEAAGRSSKALLIVGVVAVVVLAVFAYLLFFKPAGDNAADQGPVPKATPTGQATTNTGKTTDKPKDNTKDNTKGQTGTTNVQGRDPFEPLQVSTPSTGTGTDTGTTAGTDTGTTTGATISVSLVKVGAHSVTAKVDSKTYKNVGEGDTFATNFQVYAIFNDTCAGFLYGDDSFALCEGRSVTLTKLGG